MMDRREVSDLIARCQPNLFAFLFRMCGDADVAEDLMQETFVRAITAIDTYTPKAKMTTWLFQIAVNLMRDRWRRRVVQLEEWSESTSGSQVNSSVSSVSAENGALAQIEAEQVRQALLTLPLEHRTALVLAYYHDLSYSEIASLQGCPIGTVRSRIHNGLVKLEKRLTGEVSSDDTDRGRSCKG